MLNHVKKHLFSDYSRNVCLREWPRFDWGIGTGMAANAAVALVAGGSPMGWRRTQSAPPPGEAGQAAGGTRRQLRWVVGGTLLAAADRLPWVRRERRKSLRKEWQRAQLPPALDAE